VVFPLVYPGFFDRGDVKRLFDDTQKVIAISIIRTIITWIHMSETVADRAIEDLIFGLLNRFCQPIRILLGKPYEVERNPLGRFRADTRNLLDLVDEAV
jgi:hypothetical protein